MMPVIFRPLEVQDFTLLTRWLAEPHVRRFYQKTPVALDEIAREYGPAVRGEEPTLSHLALLDGAPFAYVQCYRNADYPEWVEIMGAADGVSIDLYIGDPAFLHRGLGRAALSGYLRQVVFKRYAGERRAYIGHEPANTSALRCSEAAGFRHVGTFIEDGIEMLLLAAER
ncbi:MAG: GNAT family N-acetyltransferase [Stellaceae bacterium]